jgi:hypothetical protein
MIVLCGLLADEPLRMLCGRLTVLGFPYVFVNEVAYPAQIEARQHWDADGTIRGWLRAEDGGTVDFAEVTGAYLRYADYHSSEILAEYSENERRVIKAERSMSLSCAFDFLPNAVVVNKLRCMLSNDSKPYQLLIGQQHGFDTPRSIFTSFPATVRDFRDACGGKIIFKSMSGTRSVVRLFEDGDLERLPLLRNCPVQFQEYVAGINTRVHVVGERVLATRIHSPEVDYRYAKNRYEATKLPADVERRCVAITRELGLTMSGIDLIESDGRYYLLEVNPSPAYSYFEKHGFQPISMALAEVLREGLRPPARAAGA